MPNSPRATTRIAELPAENDGDPEQRKVHQGRLAGVSLARSTATKATSTITPVSSDSETDADRRADGPARSGPTLTSDVG